MVDEARAWLAAFAALSAFAMSWVLGARDLAHVPAAAAVARGLGKGWRVAATALGAVAGLTWGAGPISRGLLRATGADAGGPFGGTPSLAAVAGVALLVAGTWAAWVTVSERPTSGAVALAASMGGGAWLSGNVSADGTNWAGAVLLAWLVTPALAMGLAWAFARLVQPLALHTRARAYPVAQFIAGLALSVAFGANDLALAHAIVDVAFEGSAVHGGPLTSAALARFALVAGGATVGLVTWGSADAGAAEAQRPDVTATAAFAMTVAAATCVLGASAFGLPVSTVHALAGASLGAAGARSVGALNPSVPRNLARTGLLALLVCGSVAAGLVASWRAAGAP